VTRVDEVPAQMIRRLDELEARVETDLQEYRRMTADRDQQADALHAERNDLANTQHTEMEARQNEVNTREQEIRVREEAVKRSEEEQQAAKDRLQVAIDTLTDSNTRISEAEQQRVEEHTNLKKELEEKKEELKQAVERRDEYRNQLTNRSNLPTSSTNELEAVKLLAREEREQECKRRSDAQEAVHQRLINKNQESISDRDVKIGQLKSTIEGNKKEINALKEKIHILEEQARTSERACDVKCQEQVKIAQNAAKAKYNSKIEEKVQELTRQNNAAQRAWEQTVIEFNDSTTTFKDMIKERLIDFLEYAQDRLTDSFDTHGGRSRELLRQVQSANDEFIGSLRNLDGNLWAKTKLIENALKGLHQQHEFMLGRAGDLTLQKHMADKVYEDVNKSVYQLNHMYELHTAAKFDWEVATENLDRARAELNDAAALVPALRQEVEEWKKKYTDKEEDMRRSKVFTLEMPFQNKNKKEWDLLTQEKSRLANELEECQQKLQDTKQELDDTRQKLDECESRHIPDARLGALPGSNTSTETVSTVRGPGPLRTQASGLSRRSQQGLGPITEVDSPNPRVRPMDSRSPADTSEEPPLKKIATIDTVAGATGSPSKRGFLSGLKNKMGSTAGSIKSGALKRMQSSKTMSTASFNTNPLSAPSSTTVDTTTQPRPGSSSTLPGHGHPGLHPDDAIEGYEDQQQRELAAKRLQMEKQRHSLKQGGSALTQERQESDTSTTDTTRSSLMPPPSRAASTLTDTLAEFYNKIQSRLADDVLAGYLQKQGDAAGETLEREANHPVARCGTTALTKEKQSLPAGGDEPCAVCVAKNRPCLVIRQVPGAPPFQRRSVSVSGRRRGSTPAPRQPPSAYPGVGPGGSGVRWVVTQRVAGGGSEEGESEEAGGSQAGGGNTEAGTGGTQTGGGSLVGGSSQAGAGNNQIGSGGNTQTDSGSTRLTMSSILAIGAGDAAGPISSDDSADMYGDGGGGASGGIGAGATAGSAGATGTPGTPGTAGTAGTAASARNVGSVRATGTAGSAGSAGSGGYVGSARATGTARGPGADVTGATAGAHATARIAASARATGIPATAGGNRLARRQREDTVAPNYNPLLSEREKECPPQ
jgi:hypothetical protein